MNMIYSKILVIGNTSDVNTINSKLDSIDAFEVGRPSYELQKSGKIEVVPENCQPCIQGKSYLTFEVYGNAVFDCATFLQSIPFDQFCVYSEDESNMGMITIWTNIPNKKIDQWFEQSYDPMCGPVDHIRPKRSKKWRRPSESDTLILYPLTAVI